METHCRYIEYKDTGMFSRLIADYLGDEKFIKDFYAHPTNLTGIASSIEERRKFPTNRTKIVAAFKETYSHSSPSTKQLEHMEWMAQDNTFTVCTAHQPNIFSGYLYFIYKTAHVIALSQKLSADFPDCRFVPVFYIGSEDNDLAELSAFNLNDKKYRWETSQSGAVGRMIADDGVEALIKMVETELVHLPFAKEIIAIIRKAYTKGTDMAQGTFILLNELFREQGLLVLQPDNASLKELMKSVFRDDLLHNTAQQIVGETNARLEKQYKLQVNPRPVNLFYLRDGIRNRIDKRGNLYTVDETVIRFTEAEMLEELNQHPERFSPNVILRGIYQETILPNILFVGGGSEVAYWMQLKGLFSHYKVPFPMLVLRNSFMLMDANHEHKMKELDIHDADLFKEETSLANELVQRWAGAELTLKTEEHESRELFSQLRERVAAIDKTLVQHVHSLEVDHLKKLETLKKKMLKAERKKQSIQLQRIWKLKAELFPNNTLQERVDNFMPYYAQYGPSFIDVIVKHSLALEQRFGVILMGKG